MELMKWGSVLSLIRQIDVQAHTQPMEPPEPWLGLWPFLRPELRPAMRPEMRVEVREEVRPEMRVDVWIGLPREVWLPA